MTLRDNRVRYESVERRADNSIVAICASAADADKARGLIAAEPAELVAVDVAGQRAFGAGARRANCSACPSKRSSRTSATLRNRINALGVAEPIIQRQGSDRIVVQLPGVQDTAQAKSMLGATATLEYRAVRRRQCLRRASPPATCRRRRACTTARARPGRQADADPAEQARDRLRRPAGRRDLDASTRRPARPAVSVTPEQRRRPAHVRLHQRQRRQADGGGLHRAHPGGAAWSTARKCAPPASARK